MPPKKKDDLLVVDFRSGRKIATAGLLVVGTFLVLGAGAFSKTLSILLKSRFPELEGFPYYPYELTPV